MLEQAALEQFHPESTAQGAIGPAVDVIEVARRVPHDLLQYALGWVGNLLSDM